jgi:hypothetical protein
MALPKKSYHYYDRRDDLEYRAARDMHGLPEKRE